MRFIAKGFIGIKNAFMEGEGVHLVVASNGAGKTSLKESLLWLLTGYARGLAKKDQAQLLHDGAKETEVSLTLGDVTLSRKRTAVFSSPADLKVAINGKTIEVDEQEALRHLGIPDPHALSLYQSEGKVTTLEELSRLLYKCIGGKIDMKTLLKAEGIDVDDPEAAKILKDLGPGNIDEKQKEAVNLRREAKRQMEEFLAIGDIPEKVTLKKGSQDVDVNLSTVNLAAAEQRYRDLSSRRDDFIKVLGKTGEVTDPNVVKEQLKELNEKYGSLSGYEASTKFLEAEQALLAQDENILRIMEEASCPIYFMPCPSKDKKIAKVMEEKKREIEERMVTIEKLMTQLEGCPANLQEAIKECQSLISEKNTALNILKESPKNLKDELATIEEAMAFGKQVIDKVKERQTRLQERERLSSLAEKASKRSELFDRIEKALSPGGVMVKALEEPLDRVPVRFAENCRIMGLQGDMKRWISVNGKPLSLCSKSQQLRAWFAIQEAIAKEVGLPFLICDEVDMLDPVNKASFLKFAVERGREYKAVLLFGAPSKVTIENGVPSMKPSVPPGINCWWIEGGVVEKVGGLQELKEAA